MTRRQVKEFQRGAGGVNVALTVNASGSVLDMDPDAFGRMVGAAAAAQIRNRGGMRALVKDTARSSL